MTYWTDWPGAGALAVALVVAAPGCDPEKNETATETAGETESESDSMSTTSSTSTSTDPTNNESLSDPSAPTCEGCLLGFGVTVVNEKGDNIVPDIQLSYTVDGQDSGFTTEELCSESGCSIAEEDGVIVITVTYGICVEEVETEGWLSCGCELSPAPWDPTEFMFDTSCIDGGSGP